MKYQITSFIFAVSISATAYAVDLNQGGTCRNDKCYEYKAELDTQKFLSTPKWADPTTSPPLSVAQAAAIAKKYALKTFSELHHQPKIEKIDLRRHAFSQFGENGSDFSDNWYYIISFALPFGSDVLPLNWVVILMDGSVVPAIVNRTK